MPKTKNPLILERNAQRFYGCSLLEALRLNEQQPLTTRGSRANLYFIQRSKAKVRGIEWAITFPEWVGVWLESGHWNERGVGKAAYCMARNGDSGPYSLSNISIQLVVQNSRDGMAKARANMKAAGMVHSPRRSGRGWTFRSGAKTPYQVVCGRKYIGVYATQCEAEAAFVSAGGHLVHSVSAE